jgi:arylformamidase
VAEVRARAYGAPLPTNGHRQKFGNDPIKHKDFSTVTHVAAGNGIAPFLILHVAENADTGAQARRLAAVLKAADVPVTVVGVRETSHEQLNANLGKPGDPGSEALFTFVRQVLSR